MDIRYWLLTVQFTHLDGGVSKSIVKTAIEMLHDDIAFLKGELENTKDEANALRGRESKLEQEREELKENIKLYEALFKDKEDERKALKEAIFKIREDAEKLKRGYETNNCLAGVAVSEAKKEVKKLEDALENRAAATKEDIQSYLMNITRGLAIDRDEVKLRYVKVLEEKVELREQLDVVDESLEAFIDSEAEMLAKIKTLSTENERLLAVIKEKNKDVAQLKAVCDECDNNGQGD